MTNCRVIGLACLLVLLIIFMVVAPASDTPPEQVVMGIDVAKSGVEQLRVGLVTRPEE